MMGRNQGQRVCDALCRRSEALERRGVRWEGTGDGTPSKMARAIFEGDEGASSSEELFVALAFCVFNQRNKVLVGDLLRVLDGPNLVMVGELLVALGADVGGEAAVERWLKKWGPRSRVAARTPGASDSNPDYVGSDADPGL